MVDNKQMLRSFAGIGIVHRETSDDTTQGKAGGEYDLERS